MENETKGEEQEEEERADLIKNGSCLHTRFLSSEIIEEDGSLSMFPLKQSLEWICFVL